MRRKVFMLAFTLMVRPALAAMVPVAAANVAIAQVSNIYQATLAEPNQKTAEISMEELRRILADGSAIVLDSRKHSEYVAGHIPGARNVDALPSQYIAAVERLVGGDKTKGLVTVLIGTIETGYKKSNLGILTLVTPPRVTTFGYFASLFHAHYDFAQTALAS